MVVSEPFGVLPDGRPVESFTVTNGSGLEFSAVTYGGIITAIRVPDRDGALADVVLGHDDVDGYLRHKTYFGAVVGRHANRIRDGQFSLDGRRHQLTRNEGSNHLHGGAQGFDSCIWKGSEIRAAPGGDGVEFTRVSPAGEQGYPGTLSVRVRYTLADTNELLVEYEADTDAPTIVNLTQHSYFNLAGERSGDILGHLLTIHADHFLPVDDALIPTGEILAVSATPFDFTTPRPIGERIAETDQQLQRAGGYDHNWVLRGTGGALRPAATLVEPNSGRRVEVLTSEPGLQFYSGNKLDGSVMGKGRQHYAHRAGLCLETQHFPDGPNHSSFPSAVLLPGQLFRSATVYRFDLV